MMEVVTGGSGSGKSAYAEQKICGLQQGTGRLYYIATMYPYGSETERKIEKHRWMRAGKGFRTLEWYTGLSECNVCPIWWRMNSIWSRGRERILSAL